MHDSPEPTRALDRSARALIGIAAAVVLVRWLFQFLTQTTYEDSLISLRYAENVVRGFGMVYNPGERVFGASTPLYVLFLAGLSALHLPALTVAKAAAAVADGITFWLWGRQLLREQRSFWGVALFALLFGLSPLMVHVSVSGMETSFALLLLTLALTGELEDRPVGLGTALGLLMWVRPDGVLAALVILGARWWRTRSFPGRPALLAGAILLPWIVAATLYYGSPVPNSIPAKAAAYNLHRPSILPNLLDTLANLAPTRLAFPWARGVLTLVICPCLVLGVIYAWREARLRVIAALFLAWWAYLVLPKTLLFIWYNPPLMLPAYLLAALGFGWAAPHRRATPPVRWGALVVAAVGAVWWLGWAGWQAGRTQRAEVDVRRAVGVWLRANTPEDAVVALEPIGYIGYYSERRVLDEVGLVSPQMIPLNRDGAGWFPRMLAQFRPDYVVERPGYLLRNITLNSRVTIFRSAAEREAFLAAYRPVAAFGDADVPRRLVEDYQFVIYARRTQAEAAAWKERWSRLSPDEREDLELRTISGPRPSAAASALRRGR